MPKEATLGEEFMYTLLVSACCPVTDVEVTDVVPNGAKYVRSQPSAAASGDQLVWKLGDLDPGAPSIIKVWLTAENTGTLASCAKVHALPRACAATVVGKPALQITKTGPQTAILGSEVAYLVTVKNTGNAVAKNVVITDTLPDGLVHASGSKTLTMNAGDLAPGGAKAFEVKAKAAERGEHCNVAVANSANAGKAEAKACTTVMKPGLAIEKTTNDKQLFVNRTATYNIVVSNKGDTTLTDVIVSDVAAPETVIVEAAGATIKANTATWNLGSLAAGASKTLTVRIMSKVPGQFCNTATVTAAGGMRESAKACTDWLGVTGVLVEVVDDPDPIQVGENTTFTIRITNQGFTRNIENIVVKAMFPEETTPTAASAGGQVAGKNVTWPAVPSLAPKQSITYTISAKGAKAGDSRMNVEVTTKDRSTPIMETESTTIY